MRLCFAWCLAACRIHGNGEKGECVAKQVLEQEPENDAGHVCSPIKHVCMQLMRIGISRRRLNDKERKDD